MKYQSEITKVKYQRIIVIISMLCEAISMRPAGHCFIYHSIYVNVSYMNNEISAKSGKSMESDPIDL